MKHFMLVIVLLFVVCPFVSAVEFKENVTYVIDGDGGSRAARAITTEEAKDQKANPTAFKKKHSKVFRFNRTQLMDFNNRHNHRSTITTSK
jgi:hypothetical protein